jgi:hypothetical protein
MYTCMNSTQRNIRDGTIHRALHKFIGLYIHTSMYIYITKSAECRYYSYTVQLCTINLATYLGILGTGTGPAGFSQVFCIFPLPHRVLTPPPLQPYTRTSHIDIYQLYCVPTKQEEWQACSYALQLLQPHLVVKF